MKGNTSPVLAKLFKELGELDTKRKATLKLIRQHPDFMRKYVEDFFQASEKKEDWYIRTDRKGVALPLDRAEIIMKFSRGEIIGIGYQGRVDVRIFFTTLAGTEVFIPGVITLEGSIKAQVFQSMTLLGEIELRKITKEIEVFKKKGEIAAKRTSLETQIANLQKELDKIPKI